MRSSVLCLALIGLLLNAHGSLLGAPPGGERLTHLLDVDPYYPNKDFPRLVTPQWVGEPGVEAVVVLAIDDMQDPEKYEVFLRPILDRLKAIDGRAALSIMTNAVRPDHPRLQQWLKEGLSIEVHTIGHPCPLLRKGDLAAAARAYHDCVDLVSKIPGNTPVAFRMPCCDSLNTPSPRFYAEIFNKVSPGGHFLSIDSSVFNVFTPDDPSLPRDLVFDNDGRERFRKYLPFPSFVNTIENYPYPYVIGNLCWEFPCIVPSDWEGQNIQNPDSPRTLEDLKAALDLVVLKQGVFNLVFHPHHWIRSEQIVELIDHAVKMHGKKVKFLNFREAQQRLDQNLLAGQSLRSADGQDNQVRLFDLDENGFIDVVGRHTRTWDPAAQSWAAVPADRFPALPLSAQIKDQQGRELGVRLVDLDEDGHLDWVFSNDRDYGIRLFDPATRGWTRTVMAGKAGEPGALPKIVRNGTNNGFFVHSRHLWWQNEDTAQLPDHVDRRSFDDVVKDVPRQAKSPQAALNSIRVAPGFKVELAACEPLVQDPIALDWGADGKLWVLEMGDYPRGVDGKGKPGGVVRFLEDPDGDGRYDKATTFLSGIPFPSGIMPWRSGVLVASAPEIFYAEDRDGDGKADHREVLFTGFGEGNQQHRLNGFEMGLDGWVYGANGDSGGTVRSIKTGKIVNIQGRDFRFQPDTGDFEAESGQTQYGRHRDDWGNWFGNSNPTWGWHFVLSEGDLKRNPFYAPPDPRHPLEPNTRLYPASRTLARFNDPEAANHVTSANSPTPYRDDLFGPHFATSLFVSEPVHNLVHRMVVEPDGATYRGVRAQGETDREFLASTDHWFRPTQLKTGPDGALWVADMYRAVIEHPEWIPADVQKRIDLRAGSQEGRIYRVFPVDRRPRPIPRLDGLDTAGLVAAIDSPNGWQRDTAMRLLLHRNDRSAVEPLRRLSRSTTRPQAKVQAVAVLSILHGMDVETALAALKDPHPQVRRIALRASEALIKDSPQLADAVLQCADDPDAHVRLQLATSLGQCTERRSGQALAKILRRDPADPWIRAGVLSSAVPHVATLLAEVGRGDENASHTVIGPLVSLACSTQDPAVMETVVRAILKPAGQGGSHALWQFAALRGLLEASARSKHPIATTHEKALNAVVDEARRLARDAAASESDRILAIDLLRFSSAGQANDRDLLLGLLTPRVPIAVEQAALKSLGLSASPQVPELLLRGWKSYSPVIRSAVLDILLSRKAWTSSLLSALEAHQIAPGEIGPVHRGALLSNRDTVMRTRAHAAFAGQSRSRQAVVDSYMPALAAKGDAFAGKAVFVKTCAVCHRLGDLGVDVGPNLGALAEKSPEALLIAILDPNRAFESRYASFTVATVDGRLLSGSIASETATAVTLRRQEGKEDVILRRDIEEMAASGQSLMPEGLEKDLSQRDLADLFAFLEGSGTPPKTFAGNRPRLVRPSPDGTIVLIAADAEIRGDRLVYEAKHGNLGFWMAPNDRATWKFDVGEPGKYAVWLDWACPNDAAGNTLEINVGGQQIRYVVSGTGTWDDYALRRIGELDLSAGQCRLEIRPSTPPRSALLDLRRIELRPRKPAPRAASISPDHEENVCSCNAPAASPVETTR